MTPGPYYNIAEKTEAESVALVHYVNDDGDEVSPSDMGQLGVEMTPYCGAVWVSATEILTAEHCVQHLAPDSESLFGPKPTPAGATVLYALARDISASTSRTAIVVKSDAEKDLALLKIVKALPPHPQVALASHAHVGDEVHIVGQTAGEWYTYMHGYISAARKSVNGSAEVFQISAPVYFGNSGGGAFDAKGDLLGIASFMQKGPDLGFFIHRDVIAGFLGVK